MIQLACPRQHSEGMGIWQQQSGSCSNFLYCPEIAVTHLPKRRFVYSEHE